MGIYIFLEVGWDISPFPGSFMGGSLVSGWYSLLSPFPPQSFEAQVSHLPSLSASFSCAEQPDWFSRLCSCLKDMRAEMFLFSSNSEFQDPAFAPHTDAARQLIIFQLYKCVHSVCTHLYDVCNALKLWPRPRTLGARLEAANRHSARLPTNALLSFALSMICSALVVLLIFALFIFSVRQDNTSFEALA